MLEIAIHRSKVPLVPVVAVRGRRQARHDAEIVAPRQILLQMEVAEGLPPGAQHVLDLRVRAAADPFQRSPPRLGKPLRTTLDGGLEQHLLCCRSDS
jgi:hypothetical protein